MRKPKEVQIAFLAYLKSRPSLLALLSSSAQIKESQWQGTDFIYPAIRLTNVVKPALEGCGTDTAEICVYVLSEQKSSNQCAEISGEVAELLHRINFVSNEAALSKPLKVVKTWVTEVPYPSQQEESTVWMSEVRITALVN